MTHPAILTVGTGAIGGYYAAKLAQAGADVATVCRSDYAIIAEQGITIRSMLEGETHFRPHRVFRQVADCPQPPDYLLVALKVLPEIDTAAIIRPAVGPNTAIVLLQNGIAIEDSVANAFPDHEIISGLAFVCLSRSAPGIIDHLGFGRVTIGHYPQGITPRTTRLAELLRRGGVACQESATIITERWKKLIWNAPFNPISVLAGGATTRKMIQNPELRELAATVMAEVCHLAEAAGHPMPPEAIRRNLEETAKMAPYKTSMLLDFEAGRPLETEAILGNALRLASNLGVAIPHLQTLYALLKGISP